MYQKDYILRMIEMLGDYIRAIIDLIAHGKLKAAEQKLGEAFYTMLQKDSWFFQNIPVDQLTRTLIEDHNYSNNHLMILAELLYAEAELAYAKTNNDLSLILYQKSLALFVFVDEACRTYSNERQERIGKIKSRIDELSTFNNSQG
jgi:hypothetical protein